jgi:hypothetical protein
MSQQQQMDGVTDADVLNAARALGSMRNVGTLSKEPAFDGDDLNAVCGPPVKGYNSQTGEMRPDRSVGLILMLRWHLQPHRASTRPYRLERHRHRGLRHQKRRCPRHPRMTINS